MMRTLIFIICFLLLPICAVAASGGCEPIPHPYQLGGGGSCTGIYGNNDTANDVANMSSGLWLSEITLDCDKTNPYLHVYSYYALNDSAYEIVYVIYDSGGNRLAYTAPHQNTSAESPWLADIGLQLMVSLSSGQTYYAGMLVENGNTRTRYSSVGTGSMGYYNTTSVPWNGGVPPATLNLGSPDFISSDNGLVWFAMDE